MSNSAVFILIANDGRADQMIMATALLLARIDDIRALRAAEGEVDINPTLADIERTHVLFMNATFKPFAAFGFEYQKVTPTGSVGWGNTGIQYSIPQSGDFFADMGLLMTCTASTSSASAVVMEDVAGWRLVDSGGNYQAVTSTSINLQHRWCDYPGERAIAKASFKVNSNELHSYTQHSSAFDRKFKLPPGKEIAYKRLTGHETLQPGYGRVTNNVTAASAGPVDILGLTNTTPALAHRAYKPILNGLQTPKQYHAAASFWHKLGFWFNKNPRLMVPSVAIPYGQRFVEIDFAAQNAMIQCVGTDNIYAIQDAAGEGRFDAQTAITAAQSLAPVELDLLDATGNVPDMVATAGASTEFSGGALSTADLYVNNVYVLPDIHDIYIHRIGFNLIRVTREHTVDLAASAESKQLHNLKWPVEAMFFGIQPTANITPSATATTSLTDWWRLSTMTRSVAFEGISAELQAADVVEVADTTNGGSSLVYIDSAGFTQGNTAGNASAIPIITDIRSYHTCATTMGTVTLSLHGTKLYDAMNATFFTDYMPAVYGGAQIVSNEDCGSHAVFFGLYPGMYQPNGHINISRARELFFETTAVAAGKLIVVADVINFLLISDGNAILRYTT
jgi:hypothetical protein